MINRGTGLHPAPPPALVATADAGSRAPGARRFPAGFVWGAATSAYQIEGGVDLDGRGPSIWDTFAAAGHARGDTGAVAADHRRRMAADVALMAGLGLPAYRFSVAWPRVQPAGPGAVSRSRARLLPRARRRAARRTASSRSPPSTTGTCPRRWRTPAAGRPAPPPSASPTTPRSWPTPSATGCAGGPRSTSRGARPMLGYAAGIHAPGRTDPGAAVAAAHHLLLAHGLAVDVAPGPAARAGRPRDRHHAQPLPGAARPTPTRPPPTSTPPGASTASPTGSGTTRCCSGRYPDDVLDDLAAVSDLAHIRDGDLAQIARPIDALGLNYYRATTSATSPAPRRRRRPGPGRPTSPSPSPTSHAHVQRLGRRARGPLRLRSSGWPADYDPPPLYVHESGGAFPDTVGRRRAGPRRRPAGLPRRPPAGQPRRPRRRRRPPRLLRVVAARQLRVGRGLPPALRHRARRLRHPASGRRRPAPLWYRDVVRRQRARRRPLTDAGCGASP